MKKTKKNGLEFYIDEDATVYAQRYRWRIRRQGRIIAASSEGYSRFSGAVNNVKSVASMIKYWQYIDEAISNYKNF